MVCHWRMTGRVSNLESITCEQEEMIVSLKKDKAERSEVLELKTELNALKESLSKMKIESESFQQEQKKNYGGLRVRVNQRKSKER